MKIVNYKDFIKLPSGTIYSEYSPQIFGPLYIKKDTINEGNDWVLTRIQESFKLKPDKWTDFNEACTLMETGTELKADYITQERDGMFDYDRKFLVYNKEDVADFIAHLKTLL